MSFSDVGHLMRDRPHPRLCFFQQPQFEGLLGHDLLQRADFLAQLSGLAGRRLRCIPGQPALAGLEELLGL